MGDFLAKFPLQSLPKAPKPLPHAATWISLTDVSLDERSRIHSIYMKFKKKQQRDFPGGPVAKTLCTLNVGDRFKSLIRELDPTCPK